MGLRSVREKKTITSKVNCKLKFFRLTSVRIVRYKVSAIPHSPSTIFIPAAERDVEHLTAKQISQMLWYFMDGFSRNKREAKLEERESFNEFHTALSEVDTVFLQSKKTGRWWMQLPDGKYIACSQKDYRLASENEIPERWLRTQERN